MKKRKNRQLSFDVSKFSLMTGPTGGATIVAVVTKLPDFFSESFFWNRSDFFKNHRLLFKNQIQNLATLIVAKIVNNDESKEFRHDQCWALDFHICFKIGSSRKILVLLVCNSRQCFFKHWKRPIRQSWISYFLSFFKDFFQPQNPTPSLFVDGGRMEWCGIRRLEKI